MMAVVCRSNADNAAGKLLSDWRRVNVALTRAQRKLVLIGSASTLSSVPLFEKLLALVRSRDWLLELPPAAGDAACEL